jgi:hypothetical protein
VDEVLSSSMQGQHVWAHFQMAQRVRDGTELFHCKQIYGYKAMIISQISPDFAFLASYTLFSDAQRAECVVDGVATELVLRTAVLSESEFGVCFP